MLNFVPSNASEAHRMPSDVKDSINLKFVVLTWEMKNVADHQKRLKAPNYKRYWMKTAAAQSKNH